MSATAFDLLLYPGAIVILFLTPGPVWVALTARALSGGFRQSWPLAVGVSLGDLMWPLAAIFGLAWILTVYDGFIDNLRWVAVATFVIMGYALIRNAERPVSADSRLTRPGRASGFMAGVVVILANPKAILFYMGVLPGFFDLGRITVADIAAILLISAMIPLAGNLGLALMIDRVRRLLQSPRALARTNRISGVLLIGVGVLIALG